MIDVVNSLNIPSDCMVNLNIPLEKLYKKNSSKVVEAELIATIKPEQINSKASVKDYIRYEEIQIIRITVNNPENLYNVVKPIFKKVRYPVLMLYCFENKFRFVACRFKPGKLDYEENVLDSIEFSSWVYPDEISYRAERCFERLSEAWKLKSLEEIYNRIIIAVEVFKPINLSRSHANAILSTFGLCSAEINSVLNHCTVYTRYDKDSSKKYEKRESNYFSYRYDAEDIWYGMIKDEKVSQIIKNKRYRNVEELIMAMDEKTFYE